MIQKDDSSFIALFLAHPVPMWVYDLETLRFQAVNTAAITHYGYTEAEFLGMTIKDIRPKTELARLRDNLRAAPLHALEKSGTWRHLKKDGTPIDVDITSHPLYFNGRDCKFVLAHDVTARAQAEEKIARLNRIYAVLSRINSTIIRTRERAELYHETCRIAIEEGEFVAAYIFEIDPDTLDGAIAARAGAALPLLDQTRLSARADAPDSARPASRAAREGAAVVYNDLHAEPALADWLERVGERKRYALAALPLFSGQRVAGVLVLCTTVVGYFDEAELRLLNELAADVSFALQFIEREAELLRTTKRLAESEAGLRRAQVTNKSAHVITGPGGVFESWSDTLPLLVGLAPRDIPADTRRWLELVHPDDRARFRDNCIAAAREGTRVGAEYRLRRGDGAWVQLRQVIEPLPPVASGAALRWFNTIQDVTEQTQQQARIARLGRIYAVSSGINSAIVRIHKRDELFQEACRVAVHDGAFSMAWIGVVDPETLEGRVVAWFGGAPGIAENILLTAREDAPERSRPASAAVREMRPVICNDIASDPSIAFLSADLLARGHRAAVALPLIRNGRAVAVFSLLADVPGFFDEAEMKLLDDVVGDLTFALQFIDNEERLSYLAYYDSLTGLANAKLFEDRLAQFIQAAKAEGRGVGVALVNVDRFAQLNDALGRHAGDELLKQLAARLDEALQGGYSLARISGSTFAVAIPDPHGDTDFGRVLEQDVLECFVQPFVMDRQEARVSARAGLALFPGDGGDAETLFKHAEVALKNAKAAGERYAYYAPAMNAAHSVRLELENELRHALEARQFEVFYQPKVDLGSGRIVSAEALVRWRHPQRGLVAPAAFIPLAEEVGLIVPIGALVLDAVCVQQAEWIARQLEVVPVAVNLSAVQFKQGKLLQTIRDALERHGLEPQHISFELTESMVMGNPEEAAYNLKALKALGVQLALDDFGTGYSSLAYLQRFPFDYVKIDRSFIANVTSNPGDAAIVTAVIAMAHSLRLRVVAEGVETEGQLQFLRKRRCDEMQGYFFSPAVPAAAFEAMLREGTQLRAAGSGEEGDTLLIVDDEPNNLAALNRTLRREGYRVLTADSGREGLRLLSLHRVQVIISDQRMPGMSGSEFLGIVKDLYPDTIRIMLSGYTDLAAVTESVNQGAVFKFMTKPWDDANLRKTIRDAFQRYWQVA
ncbi:EAL domain-containing protein [Pseudoduganella namucuonensis]|uniref:PAS domain S-box-containing protein/diguanylate cyclase (GGDEF) domain-containing protein n=1 Tax=Pseudoduganella namucuonensis TaxID=1035707 RepID=A0A1I7KPA8_9BURK|nr:EAL domain-containing protein [Pseudoduganella namucuonensis]SFU99265.1 PAS domain S-box-containing protein/diguanylate cyclase (GGDEF) domain-containing protein [Pseudoduganella namucuonensis]